MAQNVSQPLCCAWLLAAVLGCMVLAAPASRAQEGSTQAIGRYELYFTSHEAAYKFDTATGGIFFAFVTDKQWRPMHSPVQLAEGTKAVPGRFRLTLRTGKNAEYTWFLWDSATGKAWYCNDGNLPEKSQPNAWKAITNK